MIPSYDNAWQPLQPGDKVAVTFPSKRDQYRGTAPGIPGTPRTEIEYHTEWIRALGLEPCIPDDLATIDEWGRKQGAAQKRAQHIIDALNNPDIKALYITGGDSAAEVLHILEQHYNNPDNLPKRKDAPPLIGFSDATQLQFYLGEKGLVSPIQVACDNKDISVRKLLLSQELPQDIPLVPINNAAKQSSEISGKLIGGSDLSINHAHRANYRLQTAVERNNILVIEGRTVDPYLIGALETLHLQGALTNLKAIVLGRSYDHKGDEKLEECDTGKIDAALQKMKHLDPNIPIFFGAPFGHTQVKPVGFLPLPLNTDTVITTTGNTSTLAISPVRTQEDIEAAKAAYAKRTPWTPSHITDPTTLPNASAMFQPITLHTVYPTTISDVPTHFIGCNISGCDIPAAEGLTLNGQNLLIHNPIPEGIVAKDDSLIQRATMSMMELIKMGNANNIKSITFAAPVPFSQAFMDTVRDFTTEHFPNTPIFTIQIPHNTTMFKALEKAKNQPLSLHFKNIQIDKEQSPTTPGRAQGI